MKLFIIFFSALISTAHASFDPHSLRYFTPWDFVLKLHSTFPNSKTTTSACDNLKEVASDFGANAPATGNPVSNAPGPLAIRWIQICTDQLTQASFASDKTPWYQQSETKQKEILKDLMQQILGEDEQIESYGLIKSPQLFIDEAIKGFAGSKDTTREIRRRWARSLVLRDEYLSY